MLRFLKRHRETLLVTLLGLVVFAAMNVTMLFYNYDLWTNPKVGYWTAFWNHFEVSGFDPYTYIVISKWRPVYVLTRHPLLALMVWPLSWLNGVLSDATGMNCAIFIVAVLLTLTSLCSWTLMYKIMRKLLELTWQQSLLLTVFFFSFSHILIITFVEDHMAFTLPMLLLTIYLAGKAIKKGGKMPLWQSLPLLFVSTGITTTNCVKVGIADLTTRWMKEPFKKTVLHFLIYLIPLGLLGGIYYIETQTTQADETKSNERLIRRKMLNDSTFAAGWKKWEVQRKQIKDNQLIHLDFVTNTDYKIDRVPSVVENIFGEGLILHEDYALKDSNKNGHRPVLVRYNHWWYYAVEAIIVALFITGVWYGRKERIMWMVMGMFLFDMLLHVGLNFASADAYIMTAHWAFVIPIAVGYLLKEEKRLQVGIAVIGATLFLTLFMLVHNGSIIYHHIIA